MRRRTLLLGGLASSLSTKWTFAQTQRETKRIGWLTAQRPASLEPYLKAFREGLTELGYEEGRNLITEYRYGDDEIGRVPELADSLVRSPVSLIIAQGAAVSVVKRLNLPVPVLFVFSADPVSAGVAASLARPGGNMTGITHMAAEMNGKRLEILREFRPDLERVALIANPEHAGEQLERAYCEDVARRLGLALSYHPTRTRGELSDAFRAIKTSGAQSICVFADGFAVQNRSNMIEFAMGERIPLISGWRVFAESGALCTYGPRLAESYRKLASYVDRVLAGANPADLPIERPTHFETIVNGRTAKVLGLAIPPALLARADEVIE
jgi:putative tryptophan/tyrosine transport system substrate-binding protein